MHAEDNKEPLTTDEVQLIKGTLQMSSKKAQDFMTPIANVFALEKNMQLNGDLMAKLREHGHSRIPVYEGSRDNMVGILLIKSLVGLYVDPATTTTRVADCALQPVMSVEPNSGLYDALHFFQTGRSHLACVEEVDPDTGHKRILGIITMEDILEELFLNEIQDETDVANMRRSGTRSGSRGRTRTVRTARACTDAPRLPLSLAGQRLAATRLGSVHDSLAFGWPLRYQDIDGR